MSANFKKRVIIILIAVGGLSFSVPVFAADYGLSLTAATAGYNAEDTVESSVGKVISAILAVLAIAFFILVTYAGLRWMSARGNEERVLEAKNTLEAAVIGLVVILSAYGITNFIFVRLGGEAPATSVGGEAPATSVGGEAPATSECAPIGSRNECNAKENCFWTAQNNCENKEIYSGTSSGTSEEDGICVKIENTQVAACAYSSRKNCATGDTFYSVDEIIAAKGNVADFCKQFETNEPVTESGQACAIASDADVFQYGASSLCGDGQHNVGDLCGTEEGKSCQSIEGPLPYNFCRCQ